MKKSWNYAHICILLLEYKWISPFIFNPLCGRSGGWIPLAFNLWNRNGCCQPFQYHWGKTGGCKHHPSVRIRMPIALPRPLLLHKNIHYSCIVLTWKSQSNATKTFTIQGSSVPKFSPKESDAVISAHAWGSFSQHQVQKSVPSKACFWIWISWSTKKKKKI